MPTRLQRKLAEEIVNDAKSKRPKTAGQMLENVGYSEHLAKQPGRVMESVGVKEALNDLGFSEDGAKKVVASILYSEKAKDHDRLDAADKVFKVHSSYAPEKHVNLNVELEASPEIKALAAKLNQLHKNA